jgi:hypothetical protein
MIMKGIFSALGTLLPLEAHETPSQQRTLQIFTRPNSVVVRNTLTITQQMDLLVGANEYDVDYLFPAALRRV